MWTLRILGAFSLRPGPGSEPVALGRKSQAVLAWLAVHRSGGTRDALVDLLWQDESSGDARNALRQWLFQFRHTVGGAPIVRAHGNALAIDPLQCDVDLWRLHDLASDAASDAGSDHLLDACELYCGGLDASLGATAAFEAWAAAERESERRLAARMLERLASVPLRATEVDRAARVARSMLAQDPLDEVCWRALMRLHVAAGCPGKARAAWFDCRRVLRVEAAVEPDRQTEEVARSILPSSRIATTLPTHSAAPLLHPDDREAAAHDHLVRGWVHYLNGSAGENLLARRAFEQAEALQPGCPEYAVFRAWTRVTDFNFGWNGAISANYLKAAAEARELRRRYPHSPFAVALEAKLEVWLGRFDDAIGHYAESLRRGPAWAPAWSNAADALMRANRLDAAADHVRQAIALEPHNRGPFHTLLGLILFAQGELDDSLEAFQTAVRRNPAMCVAAAGKAAVLAELGRPDEARLQVNGARLLQRGIGHALHVLGPWAQSDVRDRCLTAWMRAGAPAPRSAERARHSRSGRRDATLPVRD